MLSNCIPYLFVFLLLFAFAFEENKHSSALRVDIRGMSLIYIFFVFFIFLGMRGYIGADWLNYYPQWNRAPTLHDGWPKVLGYLRNSFFENGYSFYTILLKSIWPDYLFMQFVSAAIDFLILDKFFKRYISNHYYLGYVIFLMFQGLSIEIIILRNAKTIMLFLLSIKYVDSKKKNWIKYILLNLLGTLFHTSGLFYFLIMPIFIFKRHKKFELIFFILGIVISLLRINIIQYLVNLLAMFAPQGKILQKFIGYGSSEKFGAGYGISFTYFEHIFLFILLYRKIDKICEKDERLFVFWKLFLCFLFIYLYCSSMYILVERLPNLFYCSYWILLPAIYDTLTSKQKKIFWILVLLYGIERVTVAWHSKWAFYDNLLNGYQSRDYRERYLTY